MGFGRNRVQGMYFTRSLKSGHMSIPGFCNGLIRFLSRFRNCFRPVLGLHPRLINLFRLYAEAISPKSALAAGIPFLVMIWSKPSRNYGIVSWSRRAVLQVPVVFYRSPGLRYPYPVHGPEKDKHHRAGTGQQGDAPRGDSLQY
ncbi:hypothetical protein SAMN04488514_1192 [Kriegella aquimaris]|uniref:Uncharacterized protein n=1 Tax=Kriegella aquimaris TaxID=192904 RepID=A0A1G9XSE0_9FLAO|nr:hypothetical protein SAMN04488514_1192 [Kriegella aquimaris]